jgi:hypothetical protein
VSAVQKGVHQGFPCRVGRVKIRMHGIDFVMNILLRPIQRLMEGRLLRSVSAVKKAMEGIKKSMMASLMLRIPKLLGLGGT